jgi:hypothetical protein
MTSIDMADISNAFLVGMAVVIVALVIYLYLASRRIDLVTAQDDVAAAVIADYRVSHDMDDETSGRIRTVVDREVAKVFTEIGKKHSLRRITTDELELIKRQLTSLVVDKMSLRDRQNAETELVAERVAQNTRAIADSTEEEAVADAVRGIIDSVMGLETTYGEDINVMEALIAAKKSHVNSLKTEIAEVEGRIGELQTNIATNEDLASTLKKATGGHVTKVETIDNEVHRLESSVMAEQERVSAATTKIQDVAAEIATIEREAARLRSQDGDTKNALARYNKFRDVVSEYILELGRDLATPTKYDDVKLVKLVEAAARMIEPNADRILLDNKRLCDVNHSQLMLHIEYTALNMLQKFLLSDADHARYDAEWEELELSADLTTGRYRSKRTGAHSYYAVSSIATLHDIALGTSDRSTNRADPNTRNRLLVLEVYHILKNTHGAMAARQYMAIQRYLLILSVIIIQVLSSVCGGDHAGPPAQAVMMNLLREIAHRVDAEAINDDGMTRPTPETPEITDAELLNAMRFDTAGDDPAFDPKQQTASIPLTFNAMAGDVPEEEL